MESVRLSNLSHPGTMQRETIEDDKTAHLGVIGLCHS
jgi:hypothetical protein